MIQLAQNLEEHVNKNNINCAVPTSEIVDRISRINNVLILNLQENNYQNDKNIVNNILIKMSLRLNSVTWYRVGDKIKDNKLRPLLIKFEKRIDALNFFKDKRLHPTNTLVIFDRIKAQRLQYNKLRNDMNLHNAKFPNNKKSIKFIDGEPVLVNQNSEPLLQQNMHLPLNKQNSNIHNFVPVRPNKRNNNGVIIKDITTLHSQSTEILPTISNYNSRTEFNHKNSITAATNLNTKSNYNSFVNIPYPNSQEHEYSISHDAIQKRGPGRPKKAEVTSNFTGPLETYRSTSQPNQLNQNMSQLKNYQGPSQRKKQRIK